MAIAKRKKCTSGAILSGLFVRGKKKKVVAKLEGRMRSSYPSWQPRKTSKDELSLKHSSNYFAN